MYPKLSKRFTAEGKPIYTYVCKMKERSKRNLRNRRNDHGNLLDAAIVEQVKSLASNDLDPAGKERAAGLHHRTGRHDRPAHFERHRVRPHAAAVTAVWDGIDEMTVEQKRAAIRMVVLKIIWDDQYTHVELFGTVDEDVNWRDAADVLPALDIRNPEGAEENAENLEPFGDMDYEDEESSCDVPAKTSWGDGEGHHRCLRERI